MSTLHETARLQLGDGILQDLIKQWGPVMANIILKWLLSKMQSVRPPAGAVHGSPMLRSFVAKLLIDHEADVKSLIDSEFDVIFRQAVLAIDPSAPI